MGQIAYEHAKENLGELMSKAARGEEVIIEAEDGTQIQLVVLKAKRQVPRIGCARGEVEILEGFDDAVEGFEEYI